MKRNRSIIALLALLTMLSAGCTGRGGGDRANADGAASRTPQPTDTAYTERAALMVYDYDPVRALQVIDSAVIVGNLSPWRADKCRMRIYSQTRLGDGLDSLMQWPSGARLDSARAIGERLLRHDSIRSSLEGQQDVLEMLAYAARRQNDSTAWLQHSRQLVDVCRRQGAETEALRCEAEVGAALCRMGQQAEGMMMLDSAITALSVGADMKFNELDALVIALKRKIGVMTSIGQSAEILPLARRIVALMDDYEQHPDAYHDVSYREPPAEKRDDYIRFYRSQAENYITTAYAALVESADMNTTFERLENIVREAETHEHLARYAALQRQMEAERREQTAEARAERTLLIAVIAGILLVAAIAALVWYWRQKRVISRKNRALVRQIDEALRYKELCDALRSEPADETNQIANPPEPAGDIASLTNEQLFEYISEVITRERLFLDPKFGRQTIIDRFQLSKDRAGAAFAQGSSHDSLTDYVQELRLEHAARLLQEQPQTSITQVAAQSGFASAQYFSKRFRQHFGMSPSDYREAHRPVG